MKTLVVIFMTILCVPASAQVAVVPTVPVVPVTPVAVTPTIPVVPVAAPMIYHPVKVYQPYQYAGTTIVPRKTYLGNRWFGPRVYNYYTPVQPVVPVAPLAVAPTPAAPVKPAEPAEKQ